MLYNPEVLAKAYAEVDRVLGPGPARVPTFAQINRLKYIAQILEEALRLWPTAPMFSVYPYEETTIGGIYPIDKESDWAILLPMLHRDKSVWGEVINGEQALNPFVASYSAQAIRLLTNRELHTKAGEHPSERSTRHIELALPEGVTYRAGDHLGVLASNRLELVQRVASHFSFGAESKVRLHQNSQRKTHLPIDESIQVFDLLSDYVELQDVATRSIPACSRGGYQLAMFCKAALQTSCMARQCAQRARLSRHALRKGCLA